MYLIYNESGKITSFLWENQAARHDLSQVNAFEIDEVPENKGLISDILLSLSFEGGEYRIENNTLFQNDNPLNFAYDTDKQQLKDNFQSIVDTLTLIEEKTSFTATEARQALNFLAENQKRIMKYIYRRL